jgi:hypothetical protein
MTKKEFKEILEKERAEYKEVNGRIIVDPQTVGMNLSYIESLPEDITFSNDGYVNLKELINLPKGIIFNNQGDVDLRKVETLSEDVIFNNHFGIELGSIKSLPEGIVFSNGTWVDLSRLEKFSKGVRFKNGSILFLKNDLSDNLQIEGIKTQKIINCLIEQLYG